MSYKPPYGITSKVLNLVSEISEIVAKLEMYELKIPLKLRKNNQIKTITGTLEIEGNRLGIEKVTAIVEGKRVLGELKEIEEVKGALAIYDNIDNFDYKSIKDLLKAHKMLMGEILKNAGSFRIKDVGVGSKAEVTHIAPPFTQVPRLMNDLFNYLSNSDEHPLIKSSVFHYEFEFIHPFIDGNGRIGRYWQSLILYNWKKIFRFIPIESVINRSNQKYYNALEKSGSLGESTPFLEFMLETILLTCNNALKDFDPKNDPKNDPKKRLDNILDLIGNDRFITIKELSEKLNISEKTIKRDISKLKEQNRLQRVGKKGGYWVVKV